MPFFCVFLIVSITLFTSFASLAGAEEPRELFPHGNAESEGLVEDTGKPVPRTLEAAKEGKSAFELSERRIYTLDPLIPVDPDKTYHLSAFLRTAEEDNPASANFGVSMYDEQKRLIGIGNVSPIEGTDTTLLRPLNVGDKEVWIKNAKAWKTPAEYHRIAFETESDYTDLPNFQLSPRINTITETPDGWKVTLREPANATYPVGTPIRQHIAWGVGLYWIANDWVPAEWSFYSTTLTGIQPQGTTKDHFWKGTRYVRITVRLGNWDRIPKDGARLLVDDVSLQEIAHPAGEELRND